MIRVNGERRPQAASSGRATARRAGVIALIAPSAIALAACGHKDKPPTTRKSGAVLAALLHAADGEKAPWRCATLDTPALPDEDLGHGWKTQAQTLSRSPDGAGGDGVAIGFIADAGGDAAKTIAALGRLRGQLDTAKVDLVIALGGMGTDAKQIAATLGTVSDRAEWPVVAVPGDLEPAGAQAEAIATLRKRGDHVLDGRLVRWIELGSGAAGAATIATVPGAGARERLVADVEGCGWTADDVTKIVGELTKRTGVRILASAEAPRAMFGGEATGEIALVAPQPLDLAVHAPGGAATAASGAATGGRDGAKTRLTPGTADGTTRLPDAHLPSAGVLVIRGTRWSWKPLTDK